MNVCKSWITALGIAALALSACNNSRAENETGRTPSDTSAATTAGSVRVADIAGEPDKYAGQTVTVVADVQKVHGPQAFSLDEDSPAAGGIDNDLLVLSRKAGELADIDNNWLKNKVRVTGRVAKMSVRDIEREVGWDLHPELEDEVTNARAVLIATSVERVQ